MVYAASGCHFECIDLLSNSSSTLRMHMNKDGILKYMYKKFIGEDTHSASACTLYPKALLEHRYVQEHLKCIKSMMTKYLDLLDSKSANKYLLTLEELHECMQLLYKNLNLNDYTSDQDLYNLDQRELYRRSFRLDVFKKMNEVYKKQKDLPNSSVSSQKKKNTADVSLIVSSVLFCISLAFLFFSSTVGIIFGLLICIACMSVAAFSLTSVDEICGCFRSNESAKKCQELIESLAKANDFFGYNLLPSQYMNSYEVVKNHAEKEKRYVWQTALSASAVSLGGIMVIACLFIANPLGWILGLSCGVPLFVFGVTFCGYIVHDARKKQAELFKCESDVAEALYDLYSTEVLKKYEKEKIRRRL